MAQSRIIKAGYSTRQAAPASELSVAEFRRQAEALVRQARAEADRILAEARQQAEADAQRALTEAREQGAREGFQQGYEKGRAEGHAAGQAERQGQIEQAVTAVDQAVDQVEAMRHALLRDARTDLISVALAVAAKVIKAEVSERSREIASANLAAALELAAQKSAMWIHAHPDDAAFMQEHLPALWDRMNREGDVQVLQDKSVAPGGVVVRTESGEIDGRIEAQIEQMVRELMPDDGVSPDTEAADDSQAKSDEA